MTSNHRAVPHRTFGNLSEWACDDILHTLKDELERELLIIYPYGREQGGRRNGLFQVDSELLERGL